MSREQDSVAVLREMVEDQSTYPNAARYVAALDAAIAALQAQGADEPYCGECASLDNGACGRPNCPDLRARQQAAPGAAAVGDAVVERALRAFHGDGGNFHHFQWTADQRRSMRAALEAALATPSAPEAPCSTHPDAPHGVAGSNPAAQTISKEDHNVR